jgi:ribosomal-protein-serine acetyltransferase
MNQFTVSDNIRMRSYLSADAPAFFKATDTNRAYLRPWISWVDRMNNEADALDLIEQGRAKLDRQEALILAIFKEEELIGGIGMQAWNQDLKKAEIGYWLCEKETGKGIMTLAARVFLAYLFRSLQLNKVELYHLPANLRSAAVASRLGFRTEGLLRESFLLHGRLHDIVVQGLLSREWKG